MTPGEKRLEISVFVPGVAMATAKLNILLILYWQRWISEELDVVDVERRHPTSGTVANGILLPNRSEKYVMDDLWSLWYQWWCRTRDKTEILRKYLVFELAIACRLIKEELAAADSTIPSVAVDAVAELGNPHG